jgi:hypothetical protein
MDRTLCQESQRIKPRSAFTGNRSARRSPAMEPATASVENSPTSFHSVAPFLAFPNTHIPAFVGP